MWLLGWAPPVARGAPAMRGSSQHVSPQDLHLAVVSRDLSRVRCLLQLDVDPGVPVNGVTPLSTALYHQNIEMVRTLLDHHINQRAFDINLPSRDHFCRVEPPLITACRFNNFEAVRLLVDGGANLEAVDHDGRTALYMAVCQRSLEIVRYLIDNGVSVNPSKHFSQSPLYASLGGSERREKIAELLILSGADVLVKVPSSSLLCQTTSRSRSSQPYRRILRLMTLAGYSIAMDPRTRRLWRTEAASFGDDHDFYNVVAHEIANPMSLIRLCLLVIRRSVAISCDGRCFLQNVQKLPLPKRILDLISLTEYSRIIQ